MAISLVRIEPGTQIRPPHLGQRGEILGEATPDTLVYHRLVIGEGEGEGGTRRHVCGEFLNVAEFARIEGGVMTIEEEQVSEIKSVLSGMVESDFELCHLGKAVSLTFFWGIGDMDLAVELRDGKIIALTERNLPIAEGRFAVRADVSVWRRHWRVIPDPEYHDMFSMLSAGHATLDGDITPVMQNLLYFKALLAAPRSMMEEAS